jgi:hypothetical protein
MKKVRKEFQGWLDREWESGTWEISDFKRGKYESVTEALYDFENKYVRIVLEVEELEKCSSE